MNTPSINYCNGDMARWACGSRKRKTTKHVRHLFLARCERPLKFERVNVHVLSQKAPRTHPIAGENIVGTNNTSSKSFLPFHPLSAHKRIGEGLLAGDRQNFKPRPEHGCLHQQSGAISIWRLRGGICHQRRSPHPRALPQSSESGSVWPIVRIWQALQS